MAQGQSATRIWALAETRDPFTNYASYSYISADNSEFLFIDKIKYGGNTALSMDHQRTITFSYGDRNDIETEFVGGSAVRLAKRLTSVSASFNNTLLHTYTFDYDYAPVTGITRLLSVGLSDASRASIVPLKFDWSDSPDYVFDNLVTMPSLKPDVSTAHVFPVEVTGSGKTDIILASSQYDFSSGMEVLHLDVHLADGQGGISTTRQPWPSSTGLRYPDQLIPMDVNGDGKIDLVRDTIFKVNIIIKYTITPSCILLKMNFQEILLSQYSLRRKMGITLKTVSFSPLNFSTEGFILETLRYGTVG